MFNSFFFISLDRLLWCEKFFVSFRSTPLPVNNENKFKDKFLLKKIGSISGTYNNVSLVGMIGKMNEEWWPVYDCLHYNY